MTPPRRPLVFLPQEESTERPTQSRISPQPRPRDWGPGRPFSSAYRCGGGGGGIADLPRRRWEMSADPRCRPPVKVTATSRNLFGKAPKCLFCRKPAMVRWGLVLRELSRGLDVLVLESSPAQAHFSRASQVLHFRSPRRGRRGTLTLPSPALPARGLLRSRPVTLLKNIFESCFI